MVFQRVSEFGLSCNGYGDGIETGVSELSQAGPSHFASSSRAAILDALIDRLRRGLQSGPALHARPHRSRQRLDLCRLGLLSGEDGRSFFSRLLRDGHLDLQARVTPPVVEREQGVGAGDREDGEEWRQLQQVIKRLRTIAADAADYMGDHGESALAIGCPLLSLPPGSCGRRGTARVLAPLAFVPIEMQVKGTTPSGARVSLRLAGEKSGLVLPNEVLFTWLESEFQTKLGLEELDDDPADPLLEIEDLMAVVGGLMDFSEGGNLAAWNGILEAIPRSGDLPGGPALLPGAVLGLFPMQNAGLLRDMEWMREAEEEVRLPASLFLDPRAGDEGRGTAEVGCEAGFLGGAAAQAPTHAPSAVAAEPATAAGSVAAGGGAGPVSAGRRRGAGSAAAAAGGGAAAAGLAAGAAGRAQRPGLGTVALGAPAAGSA
jgi:hypothetical protein